MNNKLPEKLTLLRKHFNYAQGDVAARLGIPVTEYMKWENGNTIPPILKLKEISDLYKVTLDSLVNNTVTVQLPALEQDVSVNIPFMDQPEESTQIISQPIEEPSSATKTLEIGDTKVLNTQPIQETMITEIVDTGSIEEPAYEADTVSETKKKRSRMIIGFSIAAAAVILLGILAINLLNRNDGAQVMTNVNKLALGDKYSLYMDKSGNLVKQGVFEPPISFNGSVQLDAWYDHALGLKSNGTVVSSDNDQQIVTWSEIVMIASGRTHSVGLKADGTVVCSGSTAACRVNTWENVKEVYAGNAVTLGITEEGTVLASGDNLESVSGQTGVSAAAIGDSQILLVHTDGHVTSYSLTGAAPADTSSWSNVESAAVGSGVAVGLRSDGTVYASSADEKLVRKIQAWSDIRYVDACGNTVVGLTRTGTLKGAGDNEYGQYQADEQDDPAVEPEQLSKVENITFTETTANVQIKWDKVKNADYYEVTFSPSLTIGIPRTASNSASVPASALTDGTVYTVTVIAKANDEEEYTASEPVSVEYTYNTKTVQLNSVTGIKGTGDVASWYIDWTAVDRADYYIINIDGMMEDRTDRPVYIMDLTGYEWTDGSSHTVTVTAYSDSPTYSASEPTVIELQFNLPRYNVTVNIAGGQQIIQLPSGNYTLAEILTYIEIPDGFTVTDDVYSEYSITSNYGITVNGKFEPEEGGEANHG
jgi:transcriptional regulator with XRE-family HTH domain